MALIAGFAANARSYPYYHTRTVGASYTPGDPVDANSGSFYFALPLLNLGGPLAFEYGLFYHSEQAPASGAFGLCFDHPVPYLRFMGSGGSSSNFTVRSLNGQDNWVAFIKTNAQPRLMMNAGVAYTLYETGDGLTNGWYYFTDPAAERVYLFEKISSLVGDVNGRLRWMMDRNGQRLSYLYDTPTNRFPARIEDGLGRSLDLTYETGRVSRVVDQGGRAVAVLYSNSVPAVVVDPAGGTNRFEYTNSFLVTKWIRPRGNTPVVNTYAQTNLNGISRRRMVAQTDAEGNVLRFDYRTNVAYETTVTYPDASAVKVRSYQEDGPPMIVTDAASNSYTFAGDGLFQVRNVMDRLGGQTGVGFETNTSLPAHFTNALGHAIHHVYAAQSQTFTNPANGETFTSLFARVVRTDYPDGGFETFARDDRGNLLVHTNRDGAATRTSYNAFGWPTGVVNAAGGTLTTVWLTNGVVSTRQDSDTGPITFRYDALFRPTNLVWPDGATEHFTYDAADRLLLTRDALGQTWQFAYDANGNRISATDPAGHAATYGYDLLDRRVAATNRLGGAERLTYDSNGRLASSTDANGLRLDLTYNANGWLASRSIGGRIWLTARDREGAVIAETSPLGFKTGYGRNALGYVSSITNPLGFATRIARDVMNRQTQVVDPLGRTNRFAFSSNDLLLAAEAPGAGTAAYRRTALGQIQEIADLRGQTWTFAYSPMGRLLQTTDPLAHSWTYSHDAYGRRTGTVAPDGSVLSNRYDAAGFLTNAVWTGGPSLSYAYDSLGALVAADGLMLQRDVEGRVTNTVRAGISCGATYDAGGRLQSLSCNNGALVVSYTYDPTNGLLTGIGDNLSGGGATFAYDSDFRLVACARSNGVDAVWTWDAASRLTRLQDGAFIDLAYGYDAAGRTTQSVESVPLDPAALLVSSSNAFTFDNASQIASSGYACDALGRLVSAPGSVYGWDPASRLTNAAGTALEYDGLGRVVARAAAGQTNRFFYNEALPRAPVVAETEASGAVVRYYVHSPGGDLLYSVETAAGHAPRYYHFDRNGSTLALTDDAGIVVDAYAYDPYGRLLGHAGSSLQPFTFLGRFGVRREGSRDLYQTGARFYDAQTARFLSREPLWPLIENPLLLNPYQYAFGNPVTYSDWSGLLPSKEEITQLAQLASEAWAAQRNVDELADQISTASGEIKHYSQFGEECVELVQMARGNRLAHFREYVSAYKAADWTRNRLLAFLGKSSSREAYWKLLKLLSVQTEDERRRRASRKGTMADIEFRNRQYGTNSDDGYSVDFSVVRKDPEYAALANAPGPSEALDTFNMLNVIVEVVDSMFPPDAKGAK